MEIKSDQVFIYPTDTVWGIGCSLYSESGHGQIAEIKNTNKNKPLSIMFPSVKDIYESFQFSEEVTLSWLSEFFKLETTLGVPLANSKIKIPKWATGSSEYVSLRSIENETIKKIYDEIKSPFFTTSLNRTGEPPLTSLEDAINFQKTYAPNALLYEGGQDQLSGASSTIVFLKSNLIFEIVREGRQVDQVKDHLTKLFY
jgi:L-threonylcarbamoyladenylate synthase